MELPTGTVTFFFSDIEGSTRLLQALKDEYPPLLERHRAIVRAAFERFNGHEVGTQGDSFFAVFRSAVDAMNAAVEIQRGLGAEAWPPGGEIRIRIGLHTGEGTVVASDYVGLDVHRAARIMAAGHGGQVVVSAATSSVTQAGHAGEITLRDLGEQRLRDLSAPERLFQLVAPGLRDEFPALRSLNTVPNNLPTLVSPMIGRDAELARVGELLESARLVTLTGPGGIGKTTLALRAAGRRVDRFPDGVWFVDLSEVTDAADALHAIVRSLGLSVSGSTSLVESIIAAIGGRSMLIILDNFEQVMAAASDIAALLAGCTAVSFLVTSREALRVRGEHVVPVAPLPLPSKEVGEHGAADEIGRFPAVALFVERAREVRPDFVLTDDNAPYVAEICARLDGLPLSIELAAARLRVFSPEELLDRLRLEFLKGGARDLPARQQTLRSTIGWSYDLLAAEERSLFALFALFSTARFDAVESVAENIPALVGVDVVERLASLVDKSLIRTVDEDGRQRLTMLETIREYALERLGESPDLLADGRRAHSHYFAGLVRSLGPALRGRDRDRARDDLEADLGNVMAAWRTLVDAGDLPRLNEMLDPLWSFLEGRGWYHAAIGLANDLLAVLATASPSAVPSEEAIALRLSLARGLLAIRGYRPEVEAVFRDALAMTEAAGAVPRQLVVLRSLATFYLSRGEVDKAAGIGRQILELGEREHDIELQVEGDVVLGPSLTFLGDGEEGLVHLERAIARFDPETHGRTPLRFGPNPGVAALAVSSLVRWMFGYPESADRLAGRALETASLIRHPYSLAYATFHAAVLDLWSRRLQAAGARAASVLVIAEERDYPLWRSVALVISGVAESALGDPQQGLSQTERGIALYESVSAPPVFWPQILSLRARACAAAGRIQDALETVEEAIRIAGPDDPFDLGPLGVQSADLLLELGDPAGAETRLHEASERAHRIGARMIELQATTRLARLASGTGRAVAVESLRELLEAFTEGSSSPDVIDARLALEATIGEPA